MTGAVNPITFNTQPGLQHPKLYLGLGKVSMVEAMSDGFSIGWVNDGDHQTTAEWSVLMAVLGVLASNELFSSL